MLNNILIHRIIQDKCESNHADRACLIYGNTRLTYRELNHKVNCLASRLAMQIDKGDKVLVKLSDPTMQLIYFFGIIKAGGACVLTDATTSNEVIDELIKQYGIDCYINESFILPTASAIELPEVQQSDIFLGALSSGSTGIPKIIWRDHSSWASAFPVQSQVFAISNTDIIFLAGSLVYSANLNACLHILFEGGAVTVASTSMPRTWLREIADCQASAVFLVPANYRRLLKVMTSPLNQIRSVVSAGSKLDQNTVQGLIQFFPKANIVEYYGASELGHVSYLSAEELIKHPDSVGKAFPGVKISLEDHIIYVESSYLAPQCRPKGSVGDLGRIDREGYLHLLGRKQGIINTSGVKVIPEQVEEILLQCPGIAEAVVGGVNHPIRGQSVCAWLVKSKDGLSSHDVLDHCRKKMLKHCTPQKIIFIDAMPLNSSGKIDRLRLQEQYYSQISDA